MNQSQKDTLEVFNIKIQIFHNSKKQILTDLDEIQKSLIGYYSSISEQIKLKNSDPKVQVSAAFEVISSSDNSHDLKQWVKKLVAMIPSGKDKEDNDVASITEGELIDSLKRSN